MSNLNLLSYPDGEEIPDTTKDTKKSVTVPSSPTETTDTSMCEACINCVLLMLCCCLGGKT